MNDQKQHIIRPGKEYRSPAMRVVPMWLERDIMSNTEPIIDDGKEHQWD